MNPSCSRYDFYPSQDALSHLADGDENTCSDDLENFAKQFKQRRIKLGLELPQPLLNSID